MLYLATAGEGSRRAIYAVDVERRIPHRISSGVEQYTSLAASADGDRLAVTVANPKGTLWRVPISDQVADASVASRITLPTVRGASPRLGANYLIFVSSKSGGGEGIWKLADGAATELWSAPEARIVGGPAIARDGRGIAFVVDVRGRTRLYVMDDDGTNVRARTESLGVRGNSTDPTWSPDGRFLVFSGPDVGTTFPVKAVTADGLPYPMPNLTLPRGARRLGFLPDRRGLVVLRGEVEHKDFWLIDLEAGTERRLTNFGRGFNIKDFDVSRDGREIVFDRVQENSDIVLIDRRPR